MALTVNGKKRNLRRNGFLAFASTSGIAVKAAKKMMQRVIALKPAYRKLFEDPYPLEHCAIPLSY